MRAALTSVQAASGRGPAHDRRDGPDDSSNPRVGDAEPLQRGVTAGIQEDVEGPQGACERVHPPGQQGNSWNSAASGEGHRQQRAGREQRTQGGHSQHPSTTTRGTRADEGQSLHPHDGGREAGRAGLAPA